MNAVKMTKMVGLVIRSLMLMLPSMVYVYTQFFVFSPLEGDASASALSHGVVQCVCVCVCLCLCVSMCL